MSVIGLDIAIFFGGAHLGIINIPAFARAIIDARTDEGITSGNYYGMLIQKAKSICRDHFLKECHFKNLVVWVVVNPVKVSMKDQKVALSMDGMLLVRREYLKSNRGQRKPTEANGLKDCWLEWKERKEATCKGLSDLSTRNQPCIINILRHQAIL